MAEEKWTFVTAYFRNHGIAYFEMIIKALAEKPMGHKDLLEGSKGCFDQIGLVRKKEPKFCKNIDQYIYLVPMGCKDNNKFHTAEYHPWHKKDSDRLHQSLKEEYREKRAEVIERFDKLLDIAEKIEGQTPKLPPLDYIDLALQNSWRPDQMHDLWQIVHELPLSQQIKWFERYSHFKDHIASGPWDEIKDSKKEIMIVEIGSPGMSDDDISSWGPSLNDWIDTLSMEKKLGVGLYGTGTHNELAWRYLKKRKIKLKQTVFFDVKTKAFKEEARRFRSFQIHSALEDLIQQEKPPAPGTDWYSKERQQAQKKLQLYKEWGDLFSIVVIGNRGTGKSRMIREVFINNDKNRNDQHSEIVEINCAAVPESLAESIFFGHKKGAFTGADNDEQGAFGRLKKYYDKTQDYGVLFLDEFHHLPQTIQSKLLVALQADSDGMYTYTPLGHTESSKVKFQMILGTNQREEKLKGGGSPLFRDFLDRVLQRKVYLPDLEQSEIISAWSAVWKRMNFSPEVDDPLVGDLGEEFKQWLKTLTFPGNFRDLERLTILTADSIRENNREAIDHEILGNLKKTVSKDGAWTELSMEPQNKTYSNIPNMIELEPEWYSHLKSTEKKIRFYLANKLIDHFGGKQAAVDAVRKTSNQFSISTLNRWLAKA